MQQQNLIPVWLSVGARDTVLKEGFISPELRERLRFGVMEDQVVRFEMSAADFDELLTTVADGKEDENPARHQKFQVVWEELHRFFLSLLQSAAETPDILDNMPDSLRQILAEVSAVALEAMKEDPGESFVEILGPSDESGTPTRHRIAFQELENLLGLDWEDPQNPLHLETDATLEELQGAKFFKNARHTLMAIGDGVKATATGAFNRKFVWQMMDELEFRPGYIERMRKYGSVFNEENIRHLHVIHIVCKEAGLMRKHKGQLVLTKRGRDLLAEGKAGFLYARLFSAYFQHFNLAYGDYYPESDLFQENVPFALFVLFKIIRSPQLLTELPDFIVLPAVWQDFRQENLESDRVAVVSRRLIEPLADFGLLSLSGSLQKDEICWVEPTPLADRVLTFALTEVPE